MRLECTCACTCARAAAHLYELLVAVLGGGPGVVVAMETGLPRQPAVVVEEGGGGQLVVVDPPRLHAERRAAVERWEGGRGTGRERYTGSQRERERESVFFLMM